MRAASTGALLAGALVLSGSALTAAPAAYAAETGVEIKKVSVNGGKAVVLGTSRMESFTISVTASDDSGISHSGHRYLGIDREVGDDYWTFGATPTCTASSATTSTCKVTIQLESDIDLPRNTLAGPWDVNVQLTSKDGDYYGETYGTHPVQRRSTLSVDASEPVTKGKPITIRGKLARANWDKRVYSDYTNQSVRLQFRPRNSDTYTTVKTVKSDSTGNLKATATAVSDGYWRWIFAGTSTTPAVWAGGDYVDVR